MVFMRIFISVIFAGLLLAAAAPAHADMAAAQQAYAEGDFTRALELWQEEANGGDADAAWYVGNMYIDGLGIDLPDPELAVMYYQMAVDAGQVEAKVSLGLLYAQGRGVEQDYYRAFGLLYQAALAEHPVAMVEIANYFFDGVPGQVEQSRGHSAQWYYLASLDGVVFAQMRYGQMQFLGTGAPVNQEEGLMWIGIAREVARSQHNEPYWSHRVFPLDDVIGLDDNDEPQTLRQAVIALYDEYAAQVDPETEDAAHQAALAWIAERAN